MRADDGDRRAALIARKDAVLERWPDKSSPEFEDEMAAVARELDRLARNLDSAEADPVERLRTWCAAGEAYLSLGAKYALQCATEAFRYAESAAARAEADARELLQLKHQYGIALLKLAADTNEQLAVEAATRLSTALSLARKHMPVGVASIKYELFRAEHTVAQLKVRNSQGGEPQFVRALREVEAA
jgi:hypothetical protein